MPEQNALDVESFLEPIRDDSPAGDYLRWESEYSEIEAARQEDHEAKSQGGWERTRQKKADWVGLIRLTTKLLRTKTKDLQIAAWLAEALAQTGGLTGVRDGLLLIAALQNKFWDTAHPESGDLELREGVYDFLDHPRRFPVFVANTPLTDFKGLNRFSFRHYKESRTFENTLLSKPLETEVLLREYAEDGKIRAADFDKAVNVTEPAFLQQTRDALSVCLAAVDKLDSSNIQGIDLRLMSALYDVSDIPTAGENVIVVAAVNHVLHFRIFDGDRERVVDTDEKSLTGQTQQIENLRKQLVRLWPLHDLTTKDYRRIVSAVTSLAGYKPRQEVHYGKKGPRLSATRASIEEVIKQVDQFLAGKELTTPPPPPDPPPDPPPIPVPRKPTGGGGPMGDADDTLARIVEAAAWLRQVDDTDPTPYAILRSVRLGELYRGGDTPLGPANLSRPDGNDREELLTLAAAADWPGLLNAAERVLGHPDSRGWLDVHRHALTALGNLGESYASAARIASALLRAALHDWPGWPEAELRDGTPAADRETRAWIATTFGESASEGIKPATVYIPSAFSVETIPETVDIDDAPVDRPRDPWDLAREYAGQGQEARAITVISRAARDARTGRERFFRTFQQAELCMMFGRIPVASTLLETLTSQVEELHLDRWEDPERCAEIVAAFYHCLHQQSDPRARAIYKRLCQLDIALALRTADGSGT